MAYYTSNRFNSMNLDANLIKKQINLDKDQCTLDTDYKISRGRTWSKMSLTIFCSKRNNLIKAI